MENNNLLIESEIVFKFIKEELNKDIGIRKSNSEKYNKTMEILNRVKEKRKELIHKWILENC